MKNLKNYIIALFVISFCLTAHTAHAAIAFDAVGATNSSGAAGSGYAASGTDTWSHTTSGTNRILFVSLLGTATDVVTGCTYAGTSMSLVSKVSAGGSHASAWVYLYYLLAPALGTNTVSCSSSGQMVGNSTSYNGVAQSGQPDALSTNFAPSSGQLVSTSVNTVVNNDWIVGFGSDGTCAATPTTDYSTEISRGYGPFACTILVDTNQAVTPAGPYTISVNAGSGSGSSDPASLIFAAFSPAVSAPGTPTSLSANPSNNQVTLNWSAPSTGGAPSSYTIYDRLTGGGSYTLYNTVSGSTFTSTVTGLTNTQSYDFEVFAVNTGGTSSAATVTSTPNPGPPNPPASLSAVSSKSQVALTWTAPSSNGGSAITSYTIYDRLTGGGSYTLYNTVSGSTFTSTVTGLTNAQSYDFEVFAVNALGTSSSAATATATPTNIISSTTGGGNWNATSTWIGGVIPGDGYYVTIQGPVVINQNIGTSGGGGIKNISLVGGTLSVNTSSPRTILFASTGSNAEGSGSVTNPGQDATMFGFIASRQSQLLLVGTHNNPITIEAANGTSPIFINTQNYYNGTIFVPPGDLRMIYTDVYNLGSGATNTDCSVTCFPGISWIPNGNETSSDFIDIENSRFTSPYEVLSTSQSANSLTFNSNFITGRSGPETLDLGRNYHNGTEVLQSNTEVAPMANGLFERQSYNQEGLICSQNAWSGSTTFFIGGCLTATISNGNGNPIGNEVVQNNLLYNYPNLSGNGQAGNNDSNTLGCGGVLGDTTSTCDSNIVEGGNKVFQNGSSITNNFVVSNLTFYSQGTAFFSGNVGTTTFAHNILTYFPSSVDSDADILEYNGATNVTYDHNTLIGLATTSSGNANFGINLGEPGYPIFNTIFRSNLIGNNQYGVAEGSVGDTYIADYNGVGIHHNDVYSAGTLAYGVVANNVSETLSNSLSKNTGFDDGVHTHPNAVYGDVTINPNYYDATRNSVLQYDSRVIGGPGTAADIFTQLGYRSGWGGTYSSTALATATPDGNPINDIRKWLFAGYAPINTALIGTGADGQPDGALKMGLTSITPSTLPSPTTAVIYSQTLTANGDSAPYTWSVSSGTLPTGLSLDTSSTAATSTISGTPTVAGTSTFMIQVQGSIGTTINQTYTLTVSGGTPTFTSASISGTPTVGQTLTGSGNGFSDPNSQPQSGSTYQWQRATSSGGSYTNISGATAATYVLTSADIGQYLKFVATPHSSSGFGSPVTSVATAQISSSGAPTASGVNFTGTQTEGQTLTGTYTYAQADSVAQGTSTFRWLRASTSGGSYTAISGATSNTYALAPADVGQFIKFEVTPVAQYPVTTGTATLSSPTSAIAASSLPVASGVNITGTVTLGQTLTGHYTYSDSGSHTESGSTFRWLRAATSGGSYTAISGATASTYVISSADIGQYLKFEVTPVSTVATGFSVQSSPTTQISSSGAPTASAVTISGTPTVGQTLTGTYTYTQTDGVPQGASTYRWLSSASSGGSYVAINGATNQSYVPVSSDVGQFIKFEVTPVAQYPVTTGTAATTVTPVGPIVAAYVAPSSGGGTLSGGGGGGSTSYRYIPPYVPVTTSVVTTTTPPATTSSVTTTTTGFFFPTPVTAHSTTASIITLQSFLTSHVSTIHLVIDGKFGPRTIAAIKAFQRMHGLTPDGVVGKKTRGVMNGVGR